MLTLGNYNHAGTNRFVTHAMDNNCVTTLCGMSVPALMTRKGQEWDFCENEIPGCVKCQSHLITALKLTRPFPLQRNRIQKTVR